MTTVTDHYGIAGSVPFANVDVHDDNFLFVDPHAVRLAGVPRPFAADALHCIDTFLGEVVACVVSSDPARRRRGEALLQRFKEPWETRLGMSSEGFRGHGGADDAGTRIWDALNTDLRAFVRLGVLKRLEDLPLFIEGIDRDITSDVTSRIMFRPLARFTEAMVARFPEFSSTGHVVRAVSCQVWDPATLDWVEETFDLPSVDGDALLLVPDAWARRSLLMSATRFYDKSVLDFAQMEQAVPGPKGKLIKTPKDELSKQQALARGRQTNIQVTLRALDENEDLLAIFKEFVASKYEPPVEGDPEDA